MDDERKQEIETFFEQLEQYKNKYMPWYDEVTKVIDEYERIMEAYNRAKYTIITTDHTEPYSTQR